MGLSHGKPEGVPGLDSTEPPHHSNSRRSLFKNSPAVGNSSSAKYAPLRLFKRLLPPTSPAKHIQSLLAKRRGSVNPEAASIPECDIVLDKNLGFSKQFTSIYELGEEVGRGHFVFTCSAEVKKGTLKGQEVAVKVIPKSKLTTAVSIEDVRRGVEILRALTGHKNLVKFYDAYEDEEKVYIVMEWCQGGELLGRILARDGKYSEEDAKNVMVQILTAVSFCHLQGVVHRGLTFENIVYTTKSENSPMKVIGFGLSDYVSLDERLNDIVGSTYYVAPEALHRKYGTEADMWSIGVLAYILLSGSRPFWAPTESGIFLSVLKEDPNFEEPQWHSLSPESIDFVKRLLHKDYRKRFTAAQALSHPWLAGHPDVKIPLDMIIYRLVKTYICSSSLRKSALRALGKTLTENQLAYLKKQFNLLGPSKTGFVTMQNFKMAAAKNSTDAMKHSRILDYASTLSSIQYRKLDFEEFCGAAISVHQLEDTANWEEHARRGFEVFEKEGNRAIKIEELASELGFSPSIPVHEVLQEWIRHTDGKLNYLGFVRLVRGVSSRAMIQKA